MIKSNSNNDINVNEIKKTSQLKETEKANRIEEQQEILNDEIQNEENSSNQILQTFNNTLSVNLYSNSTFESFRTEFNVS